jgi:hypothetical protein
MNSGRNKYIFLFKTNFLIKYYTKGLDSDVSGKALLIGSSILFVELELVVIVNKLIGLLSLEYPNVLYLMYISFIYSFAYYYIYVMNIYIIRIIT